MSGMRMSVMSTSGRPCLQRVEKFLAGLEGAREHVGLFQRLLEHPPNRLVVVDDPYGQSGRGHQRRPPFATGKRI